MNEYNFTSGYFKALSQNLAEKSEENLKTYREAAVAAQNAETKSKETIAANALEADRDTRSAQAESYRAEANLKNLQGPAQKRTTEMMDVLFSSAAFRKALGLPPLDSEGKEPAPKGRNDRTMNDAVGTYYGNKLENTSAIASPAAIPAAALPPVAAVTAPAANAAIPAAVSASPAPISAPAANTSSRVPPRPTLNGKPSPGPKGQAWLAQYGKTHNDDGSPKSPGKADGGFITEGGVATNSFGLAYTPALPKGYKDGGLRKPLDDQTAINPALLTSEPEPAASASAPASAPAAAPAAPSGIDIVAKNDVARADSITRNIYGSTPKEFGSMMGAFSLFNFVTGKATAKDLMETAASMRKMQVEGVGVAMQEALTGNTKRALQLFAESGDDRGEGIDSLVKIKINNPMAGFNKTFANQYDGLEIKYKDGSKITMDPRKFLAEAAGTAVALKADADLADNLQRAASSAESTAASRYATSSSAQNSANVLSYNRERDVAAATDRKTDKVTNDLARRQKNEQQVAGNDLRTQQSSLSVVGAPSFILDEDKRGRVFARLDTQANIIAAAVDSNILGIQDDPEVITNKRSTYNSMKRDFNTTPPQAPFKIGDELYVRFRSGNVIRFTDWSQYKENKELNASEIAKEKPAYLQIPK